MILLRTLANSRKINNFIIFVIVINAVTLGLETSAYMTWHFGSLLTFIDRLALLIFSLEILIKFIVAPGQYFKNPWNIFDFIIVGMSYIPATGVFTVFRSLRILRILLFISLLPKLRIIVQSLLFALPSIGWLSLLLIIIFYIFAVISTFIFGDAFPEWFGTLGESFYTLFQIMTLESWSMGIARPIIEHYPYAWAFFVPFVLISAFVILNVFIAVIINGMQEARLLQERKSKILKNFEYERQEFNLKAELAAIRESLARIEHECANKQR